MNDFFLGLFIMIGIYFIMAHSFNFISYTGLMSFAQGGIAAIGSYTCVILTGEFKISIWLTLLIGGLAAALASVFIGVISIRLKGMYFAIVTFGFGEVVRLVIRALKITGGVNGYVNVERPSIFGISLYSQEKFAILVAVIAIITFVILRNIIYSRVGRAYKAIGEDEPAAIAVGISIVHHKLQAFAIGSFFTGIAGALLALNFMSIIPEQFNFGLLTLLITIFICGGPGSLLGISIATVVMALIPQALATVPDQQGVIMGLILTVAIFFRFENPVVNSIKRKLKRKLNKVEPQGVNQGAK